MKTYLTLLRERVEKSYAKFREDILTLDPSDIFALSKQITATTDARDFVVNLDIFDEDDAEFLLRFKDPLDMLAAAWEEYLENEAGGDFMTVAFDLMDSDDLEDKYAVGGGFEDEVREMVENALANGKEYLLIQLLEVLEELFPDYDYNDDRGPDIE